MANKMKHFGETLTMNNGEQATVIGEDRGKVTLAFESGYIKKDVFYSQFKNGSVRDPWLKKAENQVKSQEEKIEKIEDKEPSKAEDSITERKSTIAEKRIGEKNMSTKGGMMEIIGYHGANNLDIRFEDGSVVHDIPYRRFQEGRVHNPNAQIFRNVGKTFVNDKGQSFKVLDGKMEGRTAKFTVQFDDGFIRKNVSVWNLEKISRPEEIQRLHIGEIGISNKGEEMKIVDWKGSKDITVEFPDGTHVEHISFQNFNRGEVRNPNLTRRKYLGQENVSKQGHEMVVEEFRKANDLDVKFSDGTLADRRTGTEFKKGNIPNPVLDRPHKNADKYIGLQNKANCGQTMTIVGYYGANNIDVQFEDGTLCKGRNLHDFKHGYIKNPNFYRSQRLGETNLNKKGDKMTIVDYINSVNVTIGFDNGGISERKTYSQFKSGQVRTPDSPADGVSMWKPPVMPKENPRLGYWTPPKATSPDAPTKFNRDNEEKSR